MTTLALSVEQYNDPVLCDRLEMAQWDLTHLCEDWSALIETLRELRSRYGSLPQEYADAIGQFGEDVLDDLRDIDPAYEARQVEIERREVHQRYLDHVAYGRELADFKGSV